MNALDGTATAARDGTAAKLALPFDAAKLDRLLDETGIDVLLVSSKHNVQYLLGGYRFFFFGYMDAIGVSRYLPILLYFKGQPDRCAYIGNSMESWEKDLGKFWMPTVETSTWTAKDAMEQAVDHLKRRGGRQRIGVEMSFLPADAEHLLRESLPQATIVDALRPLELLRARKTQDELNLIREGSEKVVESMLAVFAGHGPGTTKNELAEALRQEEVKRGLVFEYCLLAAGASQNRAPSDQPWLEGEVLSLDSGGNYHGYIGDLCRMGILGEPDAELEDLLAEIDAVQQAARKPIRPGAIGTEIYTSGHEVLGRSKHQNFVHFVAHGMGLISHEAPRLTSRGPVKYVGEDAERPLESGMVISIETTMHHPRRGFIKLEDTVAVTETGWEAYGDAGRGWNRGGTG
jgi:Xaa-Pro aminopeptidase